MSESSVLSMRVERVTIAGRVVLRDLAFDVAPGEIVGVAGHVGAGKTTLALAAAGLLERALPATFRGRVERASDARPSAAFVFDNPWTQLTELGGTVAEEVAVGPENQALAPWEIRDRVHHALALASADALAARDPRTLSGGELQRVALASALALDAPLLVLDEPTAQLDPDATAHFARALGEIERADRGVLLVEQNLDLLLAVADRLIVLGDGAPLAVGAPGQLLERWPPLDPRLGAPTAVLDRESPPPLPKDAGVGRPVLEIEALCAGYGGRDVLQELSLNVSSGTAVALLGANGAGKSTLARAIMGLVDARRGRIRVNGVELTTLPVEARAPHVGLVFQDPRRQLFSRTVQEEVTFGPRMHGATRREAAERAHEALAIVGLEDATLAHPGDLGAQAQRRLAIASAMAARPSLLILDEPTAGQDAAGRALIQRAIDVQRTRGAAIVITHAIDFARRACDRYVTLAGGRVSSTGTPRLPASPPVP